MYYKTKNQRKIVNWLKFFLELSIYSLITFVFWSVILSNLAVLRDENPDSWALVIELTFIYWRELIVLFLIISVSMAVILKVFRGTSDEILERAITFFDRGIKETEEYYYQEYQKGIGFSYLTNEEKEKFENLARLANSYNRRFLPSLRFILIFLIVFTLFLSLHIEAVIFLLGLLFVEFHFTIPRKGFIERWAITERKIIERVEKRQDE